MDKVFQVIEDEDSDNYRTFFARDRDRILYSKDFLRLKGKTQIFVEGYDDHMRDRLTHTLEVAHISTKISRVLNLSQDLTNAISYGHDIGHTPFGHAGERVLNGILNGCYKIVNTEYTPIKDNSGFKHNWQGIRVVRDLNSKYTNEKGFQLSKYTEWGILHHTKLNNRKCERIINEMICGNNFEINKKCNCKNGYKIDFYTNLYSDVDDIKNLTLEALIVEKADEIAQRHHDIEDGIIGGLISIEEIINFFPKVDSPLFEKLNQDEKEIIQILSSKEEQKIKPILKKITHFIMSLYIRDLIITSQENLNTYKIKYNLTKPHEFYSQMATASINKAEILGLIDFSTELKKIDEKLKKFLKSAILNSLIAQSMDSKAEYIILKLVDAYMERPQYLPKNTIFSILERISEQNHDLIVEGELTDVREFIANKHFTKLKDEHYFNSFLRGVCDFIAGMTDNFAYKQLDLIFGTNKITNHNFQK
ncbi:MAG: dNTP triphosphohydrolase [Ignavibacteria bacterium]|nr:dNTP triphosphohydrolase [Ignavibacteria bacterium]